MEQYTIVFQVLGVLLVLFFGFITYMNTKTWKWVHVTFLLMVFFMVPTFWVYAAMTLKTRKAWMTFYQVHAAEVEKVETSVAKLQRGEETDVAGVTDSVRTRSEELSRLILDRGRVWRGCTPGGNLPSITLQVPVVAVAAPPPPVAPPPMPVAPPMPMPVDPLNPMAEAPPMPMPMPEPPPPPPPVGAGHGILEKDVLYAFKEVDTGAGFKTPQYYLGEFMVTAVNADSITVSPTMPLAPEQTAEANAGNATWMLYELCPVDTYEIFAGLDEATMQQFIPQAETGLGPEDYKALIDSYLNDGKRAADNTPPDNLWVEVKFTKTHKEEVDVPETPPAVPEPNEYPVETPFDNEGLAKTRRLRRQEGDITEFEPGDTAVLPQAKADELVAAGVAEKVQNVYRRRLIEFSNRFRSIYRRKLEIDASMREISRDIATLKAANAKAEAQIALETEHKRLIDEDLTKVTFERDGIARYGSSLFNQLTTTNSEIRRLYGANHALNIELKQLTATLMEEADRRTRAATAAAQP